MRTITMTAHQSAVYRADGVEADRLMARVNAQACKLARETGDTVTIRTVDGIVADVYEPA